jgi:hypothetical protein
LDIKPRDFRFAASAARVYRRSFAERGRRDLFDAE